MGMLFRKRIEKSCGYCDHAVSIDDGLVLCTKRGVVSVDKKCRKFKYAPCKRMPKKPKAMDFHKYDEEDFSL